MLITVGGIVYLGWVAAYLVDLRSLPDGALVAAARFHHRLGGGCHGLLRGRALWQSQDVPQAQPQEVVGRLLWRRAGRYRSWPALLAALLNRFSPVSVGLGLTLGLGFMLSTLTTLGDLGESLFKRFAGIKDSGSFLPGHGGAFDRIDSLIWAGVLGYYWIRYLML